MSGGVPRLAIDAPLAAALQPAALATADPGPWLHSRRWFGGKGQTAAIGVRDVIGLFPSPPSAVARFEARSSARSAVYQVPLVLLPVGGASSPASPLAQIDATDGSAWLIDAVEDASFRRSVGDAFSNGRSFAGESSRWVVCPRGEEGRLAIPAGEAGRLLAADQSNSSIVYGDQAFLKLYRRLQPGANPEAEILGFLAARGSFDNVPRLLGTIWFADGDGTRWLAGLLQRFVPRATDAWRYVLDGLREVQRAADGFFIVEARRLGEITRRLHEALASDPSHPDFAPEPAGERDVLGWIDDARRQVRTALALSEAAAQPDAARRRAACADAARRALAWLDGPALRTGGNFGAKIRHHGDYHLGQVLRTADGDFLILDFEGEPTRPLAERRLRSSPLRDVAGMLRSFAYAVAATARQGGGGQARLARWHRDAREAFLAGYAAGRNREILPDPGRQGVLIALFELEKIFYELAYELNHRPDWAGIPLSGIDAILTGAGA